MTKVPPKNAISFSEKLRAFSQKIEENHTRSRKPPKAQAPRSFLRPSIILSFFVFKKCQKFSGKVPFLIHKNLKSAAGKCHFFSKIMPKVLKNAAIFLHPRDHLPARMDWLPRPIHICEWPQDIHGSQMPTQTDGASMKTMRANQGRCVFRAEVRSDLRIP